MTKLLNALRSWWRSAPSEEGEPPPQEKFSSKAYEREWHRRQRQAIREATVRDANQGRD